MNPFAADPSSIRGAITPLVTPFHADGSLDLDAVGRLVDWQLEHGSHGISVGGSTGEPISQTVAERIAVMRAAAEAIDGRVPFLPGTGSAIMSETLELTSEAQSLGAAAALVVTPYYSGRSRRACSSGTRASRTSSPTCRSSSTTCPIRAAVDIAPATVARLRRAHENIVGIKETTRDFEHVSYVLDQCGTRLHRAVGDRAAVLPDARARRPRPPELRRQLRARAGRRALRRLRGRRPRSRPGLALRAPPLVDAAFVETNPVPAKWIMERLGIIDSALAREPLAPLLDGFAAQGSAEILEGSVHVKLPPT